MSIFYFTQSSTDRLAICSRRLDQGTLILAQCSEPQMSQHPSSGEMLFGLPLEALSYHLQMKLDRSTSVSIVDIIEFLS